MFVPPTISLSKARIPLGDNAIKGIAPLGLERLLDACRLNNSALWCVSQTLFRAGVLVPRSKLKTAAIEQRIETISHLYPVNDKAKAFGVAVHERENIRGFHVMGDDIDIAKLWASLYLYAEGIKGWDVPAKAMCWTACVPGTVYVPYIDIDERGTEDDFHRVWTTRITPTITCIQKALTEITTTQRPLVFFNKREDNELWKYSFHIHWPGFGVDNITKWKDFVLAIPELPRKLGWKKIGSSWQVHSDEKSSIIDPAVYGGRRQLFRGPFCGKNDNQNAAMTPCHVLKNPATEQYEFIRKEYTPEIMVKAIMGARIARSPSEVTMLTFQGGQKTYGPREIDDNAISVHEVSIDQQEKPSALVDFMMPFFTNWVLPRWQQRRHKEMLSLSVRGAVVPTRNLKIAKNEAANRPGVRFMQIEGDTFCEYDEAHIHTRSVAPVGIIVDFSDCTI